MRNDRFPYTSIKDDLSYDDRLKARLRKMLVWTDRNFDLSLDSLDYSFEVEPAQIHARKKEVLERAVGLCFKAFFAAAAWEGASDLYSPDEIPTLSKKFIEYSVATGASAGVGMVLGMYAGLGAAKKIFGHNEKVLSKKNAVQAAQLFLDTFLTDSFWALAYRGFNFLRGNPYSRPFAGTPLFLLGPWFVMVSQGVHRASTFSWTIQKKEASNPLVVDGRGFQLVKTNHSFNPKWKQKDLWIGVGLGEIFFAVAALLSAQMELLSGEVNGSAIVKDSLLGGTLTAVGSAIPYFLLFLLLKTFLCLLKQKSPSISNSGVPTLFEEGSLVPEPEEDGLKDSLLSNGN